jgi:hypothetical protein
VWGAPESHPRWLTGRGPVSSAWFCESCTFFQTTIEFRPTLQKQRDDAAAKGQAGRTKIFDGLLSRLNEAAS